MTSPQPTEGFLYHADSSYPGDPLPGLLAQLDKAKRVYDDAKKAYDAANAAVKAETTGRFTKPDGAPYAEYRFEAGILSTPLTLTWQTRAVFEQAKFREQYPDLASEYTELKGSWVVRRAK